MRHWLEHEDIYWLLVRGLSMLLYVIFVVIKLGGGCYKIYAIYGCKETLICSTYDSMLKSNIGHCHSNLRWHTWLF